MAVRIHILVIALPLALVLEGCASADKRPWGQDATLLPGWPAIKASAYRAATDPKTWVPLAGAAVIYATDQDEKISSWAADNQPIFGNDADKVSGRLKDASDIAYTITALAVPSGEDPGSWLLNKTKGFVVGNAAFAATNEITDTIKERAGRLRPNGENTRSFVSGHTTFAASRVAMAMRNTEYIEMSETTHTVANIGLYSITAGMAWARVEAGVHYPTDVLAAMAVGNFIANFFNDAFLAPVTSNARVSVTPTFDGTQVSITIAY